MFDMVWQYWFGGDFWMVCLHHAFFLDIKYMLTYIFWGGPLLF
jgi:hypothetical protein